MLTEVSIILAFGAGVLSFVSPCVFPLYPAFLSYITGLSVSDVQSGKVGRQRKALFHTLFFLLGFSIIYLVLGLGSTGSATLIETWYMQYGDIIRQVGAIFIVFFGLVTIGIFNPTLLMKDHKLNVKNKPSGYLGTVLIGLTFALGWTPCMGPILAATLALVGANPSQGIWYMGAYILGFSIPFLLMAFFIAKFTWIKKYSGAFMKVGGSIMIVMGIILFFDMFTIFNSLFTPIFGDFRGF
ncbi:cytochrome c biogenesis CcdA family protein [Oceanobacillus alkalisoli]|uniref:cytochrome c biogenesis CcdA family protein n=1 Tax=Oceanobacillus alkalisoli TaxID=2925113 RepID=UPI00272ECFDE|nr:cytochrome c biogenesis protein CcdA [Oceanobacillus alkalisoli]